MTPTFQRIMAEVTRLTRAGKLKEATAAIKSALVGGRVPANAPHANVVDVPARTVPQGTQAPAASQFTSASHAEAAGMRKYKLYVPPRAGAKALPLVVMLHGCTQNPDDFAAGTRMNELALERDFVVLYPAQGQTANVSRCWNWFKHNHQQRGRGEPLILAGMTQAVMRQHNIDPQRVYVAGLSAGGAMAAILGDTYPDLFAAVGVHSGLATGSATNVQGALSAMKSGGTASATSGQTPPTIVFHGDQDTTVHPVNGEQAVAARAGTTEPEQEQGRSDNGHAYTRRIYREAGGNVQAEHWTVHGAGHAWSGGSARGSYTDAKGPDASEEMLRFFWAHKLHTTH
ncbi:PHB depolymerase family esterase [Polaromonas sp.]|uniref:extracellular catalytic domain type 1 short-chain-length polyhydroxyalkanoate depolymerase n=1 Tax=Polaromonas sp. TaxID=1869339 RepID=UPI001D74CD13|nr:PHB depolymerase family esterase [Polaromonas sp.]MBT9476319.1 PHB depolymerase family esterase [Polaromonas sp.]